MMSALINASNFSHYFVSCDCQYNLKFLKNMFFLLSQRLYGKNMHCNANSDKKKNNFKKN